MLSQFFNAPVIYASTNTGAVDTSDFIRGVDVSTLAMLEDLGAEYYQNGVENMYSRIKKRLQIKRRFERVPAFLCEKLKSSLDNVA